MAGRYAKPDELRLGHRPATGKKRVVLPASGRAGKPPALPKWRLWDQRTEERWAQLWATPQALMWAKDGSSLFVWACLLDDLVTGRSEAAKVSAEMRQHEDRHGLSPKSLEQLGWAIEDPAPAPQPAEPVAKARKKAATVTPIDERRARVTAALGTAKPKPKGRR